MKKTSFHLLTLLLFSSLLSCGQGNPVEKKKKANTPQQPSVFEKTPHTYGGWYCPDNLNGFPAVDIMDWQNVPVVNGRLATEEETQSEASLIFVDTEKYPYAHPLKMEMPRLAKFYNRNSEKSETIIVIQAVNISHDSIVGFRYLNGGNGSARLNEVRFLSENEIQKITPSNFVALDIKIDATQKEIWPILTGPQYSKQLQTAFDPENKLGSAWTMTSKVNFLYPKRGSVTAEYANMLFGNQYIQIDFESDNSQYVEKFLLLTDEETNTTNLKIVCGPYADDFEAQKDILFNWAQKVKELSEVK